MNWFIRRYFVSFLRKYKTDDCHVSILSRLRRFWNSCTRFAFLFFFSHWKQKSYVKFTVQCSLYLPYIWNSFRYFQIIPLFLTLMISCSLEHHNRVPWNTILNSNFPIRDVFFAISQRIALKQIKFFSLEHCIKYARIRVFFQPCFPV